MYVDYVRVYQTSDHLKIDGKESVIEGESSIKYTIPATEESSYNWSVPSGATITAGESSNEIMVNWGCTAGAVTCQYITECSTYDLTLDVSFEALSISGDDSANEQDRSLSFAAPEVTNATYTWTVPATASISEGQGSNEIEVDWGTESGNVSVNITSDCEAQTADITVDFIVQSPYPDSEQAHVIPGIINSVDYDQGGEGVSYSDTDPTNVGTGDRMDEAVDTEKGDGGKGNVGWVENGEWLEYTVEVSSSNTYDVKARVATQASDAGSFTVSFNNGTSVTSENIGSTGGWTSFVEISLGKVILDETVTQMTITFNGPSFNVSDIIVELSEVLSTKNSDIDPITIYPNPSTQNELMLHGNIDSYNTLSIISFSGKEVINVSLQTTSSNKTNISIVTLPRGIYMVRLQGPSQSKTLKLIRQ
ncbi:MAG: carbohydrate-binding protein [Reichenbachiella sp.]